MASQDARLTKFKADFKQQQGEMTSKIDTILNAINDRITGAIPSGMAKNPKLNINSTSLVLSARSYSMKDPQCSSHIHCSINTITMCSKQPNRSHNNQPQDHDTIMEDKYDDSFKEELGEDESTVTGGLEVEYFDIFPTRSELTYHKYVVPTGRVVVPTGRYVVPAGKVIIIVSPGRLSLVPTGRVLSPGSKDLSRVGSNKWYQSLLRVSHKKNIPRSKILINLTTKHLMHIFVGNFTYVSDFMIFEDISSIIQVVLGKPFVEVSNMTHDLSLGVVKFTNRTNEIAYKMPQKIEQYNSLLVLEKEHMKSVYLRNEEDKRRGVDYVMNKILGFYKECLEIGPEYLTRLEDEGGVT
ncbi:hypothetical protein Tco_0844841 [Tanacetum coccineum]